MLIYQFFRKHLVLKIFLQRIKYARALERILSYDVLTESWN